MSHLLLALAMVLFALLMFAGHWYFGRHLPKTRLLGELQAHGLVSHTWLLERMDRAIDCRAQAVRIRRELGIEHPGRR